MKKKKILNQKRARRAKRSRARIKGTRTRPRLAVFRSNTSIYAQLIDDEKGETLVAASSRNLSASEKKKTKVEQAALIGERVARQALEKGIEQVVFDRRHYKYHGRVKSIAEAARKSGLKI